MRLIGNCVEGGQLQMIQRNFHVWLGSAIGAVIGAIFMGTIIGIWHPDLGRLDVVSLIVVIFGVTALRTATASSRATPDFLTLSILKALQPSDSENDLSDLVTP